MRFVRYPAAMVCAALAAHFRGMRPTAGANYSERGLAAAARLRQRYGDADDAVGRIIGNIRQLAACGLLRYNTHGAFLSARLRC